MIFAMILALLVTTSGVDPASSPAASPTPVSAAPILGGITLGEDADGVLRRFGLHARGWSSGSVPPGDTVEMRLFPSHVGDIIIGILFDAKIKLITVKGSSDPHSHFADPRGIRLGDTIDRLTQTRGAPDSTESDGDLVYGAAEGVHWYFGITDQKITSIGVANGS